MRISLIQGLLRRVIGEAKLPRLSSRASLKDLRSNIAQDISRTTDFYTAIDTIAKQKAHNFNFYVKRPHKKCTAIGLRVDLRRI